MEKSALSLDRDSDLRWWLDRLLLVLAVLAVLGAWQWSTHDRARREDAAALRLDSELGATLETLDDDLAADLGLPAGSRGLVLTSLARGQAASRAGLQPGDVIEAIDAVPIEDPLSAVEALDSGRTSTTVLVVSRHGRGREVSLTRQLSDPGPRSAT